MHEMQQSASAGSQIASRLVIFLFVVKMDVKIVKMDTHILVDVNENKWT